MNIRLFKICATSLLSAAVLPLAQAEQLADDGIYTTYGPPKLAVTQRLIPWSTCSVRPTSGSGCYEKGVIGFVDSPCSIIETNRRAAGGTAVTSLVSIVDLGTGPQKNTVTVRRFIKTITTDHGYPHTVFRQIKPFVLTSSIDGTVGAKCYVAAAGSQSLDSLYISTSTSSAVAIINKYGEHAFSIGTGNPVTGFSVDDNETTAFSAAKNGIVTNVVFDKTGWYSIGDFSGKILTANSRTGTSFPPSRPVELQASGGATNAPQY